MKALLLVFAGLLACACSEPSGPIQLKLELELSTTTLKAGEPVWYRLKLLNIGHKRIPIDDLFWCEQTFLRQNSTRGAKTGTYFELIDAAGFISLPILPQPYHSSFHQWRNDTTGPCDKHLMIIWVEPGDTLTATPTKPYGGISGPPGYRLLEGYSELPPGRYIIRAVFKPLYLLDGPQRSESNPVAFTVLP